jgi:hypothetical protein
MVLRPITKVVGLLLLRSSAHLALVVPVQTLAIVNLMFVPCGVIGPVQTKVKLPTAISLARQSMKLSLIS